MHSLPKQEALQTLTHRQHKSEQRERAAWNLLHMYNHWANRRRGHFSKVGEKPRLWITRPVTRKPSYSTCTRITTTKVGVRHQRTSRPFPNAEQNCDFFLFFLTSWHPRVPRSSLQITGRSLGGKLASLFVVLTQHGSLSLIPIIPDPPSSLGQSLGSAHDCEGVANNHKGLRFPS